jgi:hypothetical protein
VNGLLVRESLVRACGVETHVLGDDALRMFLAEDEDVTEQISAERAAKRSAKVFMSGARTAVRTTRTPDDVSTPAKRAPSFVSWSQTSTSGAPSMVAFRACCAASTGGVFTRDLEGPHARL